MRDGPGAARRPPRPSRPPPPSPQALGHPQLHRMGGRGRLRAAGGLLIKTFLLQAFYIPSPSMTPTLQVDDRVLVNKLSYDLHDVHRGDIVVFRGPPSEGRRRISSSGWSASPATSSRAATATSCVERRDARGALPAGRRADDRLRAGHHRRRPLLGDGRQPPELERQPVLRSHRRVPDHRPRPSSKSGPRLLRPSLTFDAGEAQPKSDRTSLATVSEWRLS